MRIRNYRSFVDEVISFDDITAVVGPNEGGKTNILRAITHLDGSKKFEHDDLRKGSKNYPSGEIELVFELSLTKNLIPNLYKDAPFLGNKTLEITKRGKIDEVPTISYRLIDLGSIEKIIYIKKPPEFKKMFDADVLKTYEDALKKKWFLRDTSVNLSANPFAKMRKSKVIEVLDTEEKQSKFLAEKVYAEIQENIQIYFWEYDKEGFLKNIVPIADLVANPDKHTTIRNLFYIAGWNNDQIYQNLCVLGASDSAILLKKVEGEINKLIKKSWRQHSDLKVSVQHRQTDLVIHLEEVGSLTQPELRSDGLKWFLSFLINFRAKSSTLSDFLVLVDEPALNLHPRGQKDVLSEIKELGKSNQVVYTTHQTFMIDKNFPSRVRVLRRQSVKSDGADYYFASKITDEIKTGDITSDPLLREALGFKVSDISPINDYNLLVEGRFDRNLILLLNEYYPSIDLEEYSVIACAGAPDIKRFANWLQANDLRFFCLYDSDSAGLSSFNSNAEDAIPNELKTHLKLLKSDFASFETPEDLFDETTFKTAIKAVKGLEKFAVKSGSPRCKQLNTFFDQNNFSKESRIEVKHALEDELIEITKTQLKGKKLLPNSPLHKYLTSLSVKLPKQTKS